MGIVVRRIETAADFEAIAQLRYEVSAGEYGHAARKTPSDELDAVAAIYGAFEGAIDEDEREVAVATGRVVPVHKLMPGSPWRDFYDTSMFPVSEEQAVIYGRLMVRESHRGTMAVPQILVRGFEDFRAQGIELGFLHCTPSLVPLYEVLGCRRYKRGLVAPDTGFRLPMVQLLGDLEHFTRVRAPILNSVKRFDSNPVLAAWFQQCFAQYSQPSSVRMMSEEDFMRTLSRHIHHESSPLFENIASAEAQQLIRSSTVLDLADGDVILRRGDIGAEMYLVLEGAVEISTRDTAGTRILGTLGHGQFFGEGGFLFGQPRSADVTAIAPTKLLALGSEAFEKVIAKKPELAARVLLNLSRVLCQRLYSAN